MTTPKEDKWRWFASLVCLPCQDNRHELCPQLDNLGCVCICACHDEAL